jgi:hypothetical protein
MHVIAPFWATIDPDYQEGLAEAGDTAHYTVTINNIGENDDVYDLAVVSSAWTMVFPGGPSVSVPHGGSADFAIDVTVPPGTVPGVFDTGTFSVTSHGEPALILQGQIKTTCASQLGSIGGTITHDSSIPLAGAIISIDGTTLTDVSEANGTYFIANVPVGTYIVRCVAIGYNPSAQPGIVVEHSQTTTVNFDMLYPSISVDHLSINHQMNPDEQSTLNDAVTISNNGTGYLDYTVTVEAVTKLNRDIAILLVSDPTDGTTTSENYDAVYQAAITAAGYSSTLWNHDTQGSPTLADLTPYDVVVWYTGVSQGNAASDATLGHSAISLAEEATLTSWLDLGGKSLCLSGMWIAWNCIADANSSTQMASNLFDNYIQLTYPAENFSGWIVVDNTWTLTGQGGPIGGSENWPVAWVSAENYPDQLEPNPGGAAIFSWNESGTTHHQAGIQYDGSTFRTVLLGCPLEEIGTATEKSLLMNRMIDWFSELATTWLTVDPTEGRIIAGANQPLDLMFDTTGMTDGNYLARIHVASNDSDQPEIVVDVNLAVGNVPTVTPPLPTDTPGGPTITPTPPPTISPSAPPTATYTQIPNTSTPTPTSTPPPPPTSTPTVSNPSPTPGCTLLSTTLDMPSHMFSPGDDCGLNATVCNTNSYTLEDIPFFAILDVYSNYFFWPTWTNDVNWEVRDFPPQVTTIELLPPFIWPDVDSSADGLIFYGAMVTPEFDDLIGELGIWNFGYTYP